MRTPAFLALSVCLCWVGCGGGGSKAPVPAPSNLTATYDPPTDAAYLAWTAAPGAVDGYNLEASLDNRAFQKVNTTLIPSSYTSGGVSFAGSIPEQTTVYFRLDAQKGGDVSTYTNVATCRTPLWSPGALSVGPVAATGAISVGYPSTLSRAPSLRLERAECDAAGSLLGAWMARDIPRDPMSTYLDTALVEGARYVYRAASLDGTETSEFGPSSAPVLAPVQPPGDLRAASLSGGFSLTWTNRTRNLVPITVHRGGTPGTFTRIAVLAPDATSFLDPGLSPGYYTYYLTIPADYQDCSSAVISVVNPGSGNTLALVPYAVASPTYFNAAALAAGGAWGLGVTAPLGVQAHGGSAPWTSWAPGDSVWATSGFLRMDTGGRPHAVYGRREAGGAEGTYILGHAWFDGAAWQKEDLARGGKVPLTGYTGYSFALDGGGQVQALMDTGTVQEPTGGTTQTLKYVHRSGGAWATEALFDPGAGNLRFTHALLSLDAAGSPHVLLALEGNKLSVLDRNAEGSWTGSTVSTAVNPYTGSTETVAFLTLADATPLVFYCSWGGDFNLDVLKVVQRTGGEWQAPLTLQTGARINNANPLATAVSPDLTRIAVVSSSAQGVVVHVRTAAGWGSTLVAAPSLHTPPAPAWVAFDSANRIHVLVKGDDGTATDYHE